MLPLGSLLDDDGQTAKDGPYPRLMKLRKWLVALVALTVATHFRWVDTDGLKKSIGFVAIPPLVLNALCASILLYVSTIYTVLIVQYVRFFEKTIRSRLDEKEATKKREIESEIEVLESAVADARRSKTDAEATIRAIDTSPTTTHSAQRRSSAENTKNSASSEAVTLQTKLDRKTKDSVELASTAKKEEGFLRITEGLIDILRLTPPLTAAFACLVFWLATTSSLDLVNSFKATPLVTMHCSNIEARLPIKGAHGKR